MKLPAKSGISGTPTNAAANAAFGTLWDALQTMGLQTATRTNKSAVGPTSLVAADFGLVLIDATSNNVTLTLPASGSASDDGVFEFRRIDVSGNTVTIQRAGGDTIDGVTSVTLGPSASMRLQIAAGSTVWRILTRIGNVSELVPGAFTTVDASGTITSTKSGAILQRIGASTAAQYIRLANTTGDFYVGVESSSPGGFFTGSSAYASVLYSATALEAIIATVKRATIDANGVSVVGWVLSSAAAAGIGYTTGAGGTVTQATNRTTGVTLNKVSGGITLVSAAGSTAWQSFTLTNSAIAATDTVVVNQKSGTDKYMIHVTNVAGGSCQITFATTGGTTTEQPVFNFNVIKGIAA